MRSRSSVVFSNSLSDLFSFSVYSNTPHGKHEIRRAVQFFFFFPEPLFSNATVGF